MMRGMELMLQIFFSCLRCWRFLFKLAGSVCSTWFFASLVFMRRVDKLEGRFGVNLPEHIWNTLPLARDGFSLALIAATAACCFVGVWAVRGLERQGY